MKRSDKSIKLANYLEEKVFQLKNEVKELKKSKPNVTSKMKKEVEGHLEILKIVQEENYSLNIELKESKDKNQEYVKRNKILKREVEQL